jgi:hypothetical protein
MAKLVRETSAGKAVKAFVILKAGKQVATVHAHTSANGVSVNVWNIGDKATLRSYKAAMATIKPAERRNVMANAEREALKARDWVSPNAAEGWAAFDLFNLQKSHGDSLEEALAGLWVDGHQLFDHSTETAQTKRLYLQYSQASDAEVGAIGKRIEKLGAQLANWVDGEYSSVFMLGGLRRLEKMGYTVISAI